MVQRAKRLDRRGPDWVGVGISVVLSILLVWLCVDAYRKVGVRQDLIKALNSGDVKQVQTVLNDRRITNKDKSTALSELLSSYYSQPLPGKTMNPKLLTLLLDHGADPNEGEMVIYWPALYGDEKVIKILLARGLRLEKSQANAETYLTAAVSNDHGNMVRFLLDYGLPLGGAGGAGEKVLETAVIQNKPACAKVLLDRGVSPNISVGASGISPQNEPALCTALSMQYWEVARALVLHHANVNAPGANGRTPLSIVTKLKRKGMIAFLKAHGAKQ